MKKALKVVLLLVLLGPAARAHAQVYGQFTGAACVPVGAHLFGGYLQASDSFLGLSAQLRLSFYPDVDFGFQGGLTRADLAGSDVSTLRLGADLKAQVVKGRAADVAIGGALGVETGDNIHTLVIGPSAVVSRALGNPAGAGVTPYASVGLLFTNSDILDQQANDFGVPFRFGAEFRLSPELRLMGEIQLTASDPHTDSFAFVTGVNLPF